MKIKPLFDRVVLQEILEKEPSGILLPESAVSKPQIAIVMEVGPGGTIDGNESPMQVKVSDKVLFNKYAGSEFKLNDQTFILLNQSDVLAILED